MKSFLVTIGIVLVSLGGSLAVNHFPLNLLLSFPGGVLIGVAVAMKGKIWQ
jgi:hypothetical protein